MVGMSGRCLSGGARRPVVVLDHLRELAIVHARALQAALGERKAARADEVQGAASIRSQPYDVARVGRKLRLDEDDVVEPGCACATALRSPRPPVSARVGRHECLPPDRPELSSDGRTRDGMVRDGLHVLLVLRARRQPSVGPGWAPEAFRVWISIYLNGKGLKGGTPFDRRAAPTRRDRRWCPWARGLLLSGQGSTVCRPFGTGGV